VTRLDKDTSGVVLAGLTGDAHARIQKDMSTGRVRKEYLAIVRGVPDPAAGAIVLPLARDRDDRRRVVVDGGGAYCETRYEVVTEIPERSWSLVRCRLVTGRTHQIRVHLAERGWPLVGDPVYGAPSDRIARQALHAWRVTFPHPASTQMVTVEAPLPADMAALLPQNLML
jgi:23S rRNA pseudouridine1911/1915/1917 synthase